MRLQYASMYIGPTFSHEWSRWSKPGSRVTHNSGPYRIWYQVQGWAPSPITSELGQIDRKDFALLQTDTANMPLDYGGWFRTCDALKKKKPQENKIKPLTFKIGCRHFWLVIYFAILSRGDLEIQSCYHSEIRSQDLDIHLDRWSRYIEMKDNLECPISHTVA